MNYIYHISFSYRFYMLECSPHGRKVGWSLVPAALFHHWTLQEAILFPKLGGSPSLTGDVCVETALSDMGKFRRNSENYIRIQNHYMYIYIYIYVIYTYIYIYIYVYIYIVWISSLCSLGTFPRMLRSGVDVLPFCSHSAHEVTSLMKMEKTCREMERQACIC